MRSVLRTSAILAALAVTGGCGEGETDPSASSETAEADSGESGAGGESGDTGGSGEATTEGTPGLIPDRPCPPDSFVTSENFGLPFVTTWCTGCHSAQLPEDMRQGAPVGIDFDTMEGIEIHAERIYARSGDANETMPPLGGPSAEERAFLGDWITCGMQ